MAADGGTLAEGWRPLFTSPWLQMDPTRSWERAALQAHLEGMLRREYPDREHHLRLGVWHPDPTTLGITCERATDEAGSDTEIARIPLSAILRHDAVTVAAAIRAGCIACPYRGRQCPVDGETNSGAPSGAP